VPRAEWKVFLPNAHPGYVTWEEFETNQATLLTNANGYGPDRRRSPAREGVALLQGLVLCGRCGDRMTVRYTVAKDGQRLGRQRDGLGSLPEALVGGVEPEWRKANDLLEAIATPWLTACFSGSSRSGPEACRPRLLPNSYPNLTAFS
jgi:hypothetical protein